MNIERLTLSNYRNYREADVQPCPGLNIIWGRNAAGKTNLLEAVMVASTGRSPRASRDSELVKWNEEGFHVAVTVRRGGSATAVEVGGDISGRKVVRVNGREKRVGDLLANLNTVSFLPDDVLVVKGSPARRRRLVDLLLAQGSPGYHYHLLQYQKVLLQRNALLRDVGGRRAAHDLNSLMEPWDRQLAGAGAFIMQRRAAALATLSAEGAEVYSRMSGGESLRLGYVPSVPLREEDDTAAISARILGCLRESRAEDLRRGATTVGPHRDDISFTVDGADALVFGSQGQQRTIILAVKAAEVRYLQAKNGEAPVLLLDDVFSELDDSRQASVAREMAAGLQCFITCTEMDTVEGMVREASIYRVEAGEVALVDAAQGGA
ncbi:MAG: DNA replication/repair protein RecF [Bacillota bacterium]